MSCTNKCDYFQSAKKIENQKQIGKITLHESIKLYNSLNKKIIPKLDNELILDKDEIKPRPNNTLGNIGKFTNLKNNYDNHIRLDSDSESDISYILTDNSFSSLSELDLQ